MSVSLLSKTKRFIRNVHNNNIEFQAKYFNKNNFEYLTIFFKPIISYINDRILESILDKHLILIHIRKGSVFIPSSVISNNPVYHLNCKLRINITGAYLVFLQVCLLLQNSWQRWNQSLYLLV